MIKELAIIYDGPATTSSNIESIHNVEYYLRFFDKIIILYWAKSEEPRESFVKKDGKLIFYPYRQPYNSRYITGFKFMVWVWKTLWQICRETPKEDKLILMPVIPIWAGLPTLIIGKIKRKKVILRLEADKINYLSIEEKLEGRPIIFTAFKILILKIIYFLTLPFYDLVIAISDGIKEEAKSYRAKTVVKIPIPINIEPFLKITTSQKINPAVIYVGQIKKVKGIFELIKALDILKEKNNFQIKTLIVGGVTNPKDEIFFEEAKKRAKNLNIEFLGNIPHWELPQIYKQADIFVLPSYSEALGMAIMEAMAAGLPVIASDLAGPRELIKNSENGFLVKVGDPNILAQKLALLFQNPGLRKKMGETGRQKIKEILAKTDKENQKLWQQIL